MLLGFSRFCFSFHRLCFSFSYFCFGFWFFHFRLFDRSIGVCYFNFGLCNGLGYLFVNTLRRLLKGSGF